MRKDNHAHEHHPDQAHEGNDPQGHDHSGHHAGHDHGAMIVDFRRRFWVSLILTVPILLLSPMIQGFLGLDEALAFPGDRYLLFVLSVGVFVYGGWPFLTGLVSEIRQRAPGMMTLIALAISVAFLYSSAVVFGLSGRMFFWELATLVDVMLLGHWIEMRSIMGASGALEALVKLMPATAHRLTDSGDTEDVRVDTLEKGDRVRIKPGEKIPTDGLIVEGRSNLNESLLTGESRPVSKGPDDEVIGGAINGEGSLTVEIQRTGEATYLAQVIEMVKKAQASRSRTQDLANRAAAWLTYIALTVGAITLITWLILGYAFDFSLERMVTVMVITCPHALGLAIPLVIAVSTSKAARNGLLIRDRAAFERARNTDVFVFDKTGTLTEGRFGVSDVVPLGDRDENDVLKLAGALESRSEHPIAVGITEKAAERDIVLPEASDFENLPGEGVQAQVDGETVRIVSPGYLERQGIAIDDERVDRLAEQGKTVVFVLLDDRPLGAVALSDIIREVSREAVDRLRAMGMQCMMLTGDSQPVAKAVADELGLDDFFAEVMPDQKAARIRELKEKGLSVAMVGDGVNDAPALTEADLGIAIGAGTDVAVESADIVLVNSDPRDVATVTELSAATYRKMIQNLWWAAGYNIVAIPLAAGVLYGVGFLMPPAIGAAVMSVSTIVVAINAKLLERFKPASETHGEGEATGTA
ncbi:heavy metal translocating P-type ATPase [Guyparkeria sp. GHLCS8-2]|uniref:heavy metal translocating P-type ATPase n=1 Tax=Guyparkeria halopsychrophila TaxID=3139421 RepID=UPI0037C8EE31